jgi:hypothetical protein
MIYSRFPKEGTTKVCDRIIDCITHSYNVEVTSTLSNDRLFFVGGPRTSLNKIKDLEKTKTTYINVDKGYFRNRKSTSHWRLSYNSLQQTQLFNVPDDRLKKFNINIKPWKTTGSYILILAPNPNPLILYKGHNNITEWALSVRRQLLQYTDRKIFIRFKDLVKKGYDPIQKYYNDCYAIISLQSLGVVDATLHGIPCINLAPSCLDSLHDNKLEDIENLTYPENRWEWIKSLSYGQFTTEEMKSGYALKQLQDLYNI